MLQLQSSLHRDHLAAINSDMLPFKMASFTAQNASAAQRPSGYSTVLYTHTLCPYAERAWLALLEKGVPFHLCHIDLAAKPTWYRRVNPRGLVPALEHDGTVHTESLDICRFVDASFEGPPLAPADPEARAAMDACIREAEAAVEAGLALVAGKTGRYWGIGAGQTAAQRAALQQRLQPLGEALQASGGPYLLGTHVTLADLAVFPFLRRYDLLMRGVLRGCDAAAVLGPRVGGWLEAMAAREACAVSSADDALLLSAYRRHQCLDFFDYDSYGAFDCHPQNRRLLL